MDEDSILIEVRLDDREITRQMDALSRKLQKSLDTALGRTSGGGSGGATRAIKDQEAAALRLAQAQARLATASGNLTKAQTILETALGKTTKETVTQIGAQTQLVRVQNQLERSTRTAAAGVSSLRGAFAALAAIGIVSLLERVGRAAVQAAIDVDKQVNALKALTGSAEAAEKRFAALFALSQKTPGLTTSLAATLDAQLRVFSVTEQTINRLLPVIGRLNAISPLGDPRQFVNNFVQLITQNFERQDLKELIGQSPIAGLLIKEIFNVDNPTNAAAIRAAAKRLGITTVERLAEEFTEAGAKNAALRNATEGIAGQFEKMRDRITVALRPVGNELTKILLVVVDDAVRKIEQYGSAAARVFAENRNDIIATAKEITAMTIEIGKLVGKLVELGARSHIFEFIARGAASFQDVLESPSRLFSPSLGPREQAVANQFEKLARDTELAKQAAALNPLERQNFALRINKPELAPTPQELREFAVRTGNKSLLSMLPAEQRAATGGAGGGGITGGGTGTGVGARRDRFINDFGLGETAKLEHEIELARIRQSNLQVVLRRQAPFDLQALPRLAATGVAAPDLGFSGQELAELARIAAEVPAKITPIMSDVERFMRGFGDSIETVGDSFERFGSNVARAFTDVRTLFDSLKRAVLDFFNDLLGNALQNLVRNTLGGLFGGLSGSLGNLFRGSSGGGFGGLAQAFAGAAGNAISAPASISQAATGIFANGAFARGLSGATGGGGTAVAGSGFSFGGLLGGLAGAAPLLGLGLGAGLGGQSTLGQIAGAIGGGAVGLGLSFGASVFSAAGGGLGALGPAALAALGPIALIGAPLLVGAVLLGRSAQRRKDEEASGQFLTQALQGIQQLAAGVASGQIPSSQARGIFDSQILGVFRQQILGLKTKSVRESRLTNQVRDLERNYQDVVGPAMVEQARRSANAERFSRQIPEFATGGTARGGLAFLHEGEKVVNLTQQTRMRVIGGADIFERAGVPNFQRDARFDDGGTFSRGLEAGPIVIEKLTVSLLVGKDDATRIVVTGGSTTAGRAVTVKNINVAKTNREL